MNGKILINNLDYTLAKECADLTDIKIKSVSRVNVKENKSFLYFTFKSVQSLFDFGRYYETLTPSHENEINEDDLIDKNERLSDLNKPKNVKTKK